MLVVITDLLIFLHLILQLGFLARSLLRPHRDPASRLAWVVVILALPLAGMIAYLLFGETSVGRRRIAKIHAARAAMPIPCASATHAAAAEPMIPAEYTPLFRVGQSINGHPPTAGNSATLMPDSDAAIASMVADIDAAREHVHVLFYIWLADYNGLRVVEALKRAAARGVTCRAKADEIGSRALIRSRHWQAMCEAGVKLARAMPLNPLRARMDMRNHRKIVVVDNRVTYCGSQNCADPAFEIKAKYAPWVDIMLRFEGPIVLQNQRLFAIDWMTTMGENLAELFDAPIPPAATPGFVAQVIGTSAAVHNSAMPEMFIAMMGAARHKLVITTPYYVPDDSIQTALCGAARRGVDVTIVFPARNDSWIVAAASHSYYHDLLAAGVRVYEYLGGLLHAKTLTVDGTVALIGSANLDRRSFDLNAENNILLCDRKTTSAIRERQQTYLASAREIGLDEVTAWPWPRRLWNNAVAMSGPLL
ncbi:MAG: cardiolipin synthase [Nitrococcus sp.]|nr:cardiolipin synthase [Nitrococcus sp.]